MKMETKVDISAESQKREARKEDLRILGLDLNSFPPAFQFLLCTVGVFFFYLIYGYFQELIFKLEGFRPFGWYLTLIQFGCYVLFGLLERHFKENKDRRIPMKTYAVIALLTVGTMGLSNTSVGYLNYPTQVIFKCCKLIPVLIGGIFIQGKRFSRYDVSACVCMSMGLILFTLADSTVSPNFNTYGVALISLALCADAAIGNVQEKAMRQFCSSNSEMVTRTGYSRALIGMVASTGSKVLYSYGLGFFYILAGLIITGEIRPAYSFCKDHPVETYGYAVIFSLTGYLGLNFVLSMVKTSGALIAVTVTTCRKAVTIILSFLFFTKPFTMQYVWSGLVVLMGIYLNVYSKNKNRIDALLEDWPRRLLHAFQQDHMVRTFNRPNANIV